MAHRKSAIRNRRNEGLFQQFLLFIKIELNITRRKQEDAQHNHNITIAARLPKLYAEILQRPPGSIIDGRCYDASETSRVQTLSHSASAVRVALVVPVVLPSTVVASATSASVASAPCSRHRNARGPRRAAARQSCQMAQMKSTKVWCRKKMGSPGE